MRHRSAEIPWAFGCAVPSQSRNMHHKKVNQQLNMTPGPRPSHERERSIQHLNMAATTVARRSKSFSNCSFWLWVFACIVVRCATSSGDNKQIKVHFNFLNTKQWFNKLRGEYQVWRFEIIWIWNSNNFKQNQSNTTQQYSEATHTAQQRNTTQQQHSNNAMI